MDGCNFACFTPCFVKKGQIVPGRSRTACRTSTSLDCTRGHTIKKQTNKQTKHEKETVAKPLQNWSKHVSFCLLRMEKKKIMTWSLTKKKKKKKKKMTITLKKKKKKKKKKSADTVCAPRAKKFARLGGFSRRSNVRPRKVAMMLLRMSF